MFEDDKYQEAEMSYEQTADMAAEATESDAVSTRRWRFDKTLTAGVVFALALQLAGMIFVFGEYAVRFSHLEQGAATQTLRMDGFDHSNLTVIERLSALESRVEDQTDLLKSISQKLDRLEENSRR